MSFYYYNDVSNISLTVCLPCKKVDSHEASSSSTVCNNFDCDAMGHLKLCSSCRTVSYCTNSCKQIDRKSHEAFCKLSWISRKTGMPLALENRGKLRVSSPGSDGSNYDDPDLKKAALKILRQGRKSLMAVLEAK
jgi:hypothetical protein